VLRLLRHHIRPPLNILLLLAVALVDTAIPQLQAVVVALVGIVLLCLDRHQAVEVLRSQRTQLLLALPLL
jgi:hypothetical protein